MPLYDYQCRTCSKVTEVRHGFREAYGGTCPDCGGELARVFNPAGIVFKGSGFYITDSRKGSGSESASSSGDGAAKSSDASKPSDSGAKSGDSGAKSGDSGAKSGDSGAKSSDSSAKPSDSGSKKSESSAA